MNSPEYQREWYKNNKEKHAGYQKKHRAKKLGYYQGLRRQYYYDHKEQQWIIDIKRMYGITPDDYFLLEEQQKNLCAICGTDKPSISGKKKKWHIDHNHETGEVRGLLCNNCNWLLGLAKDNIEILEKSIMYLQTKTRRKSPRGKAKSIH